MEFIAISRRLMMRLRAYESRILSFDDAHQVGNAQAICLKGITHTAWSWVFFRLNKGQHGRFVHSLEHDCSASSGEIS